MTEKHHCQILLLMQRVFVESLQRNFSQLNPERLFPRLAELTEMHTGWVICCDTAELTQGWIDNYRDPIRVPQIFEETSHTTEGVAYRWRYRRYSAGILLEYVGPEADQRIWWILFESPSRTEHIQGLPNGRSAICWMAQAQTNQSIAQTKRNTRMHVIRGTAPHQVSVAHRGSAENDTRKSNRIGEFAECMQISEDHSLPCGCSGCREAERGSTFGNI